MQSLPKRERIPLSNRFKNIEESGKYLQSHDKTQSNIFLSRWYAWTYACLCTKTEDNCPWSSGPPIPRAISRSIWRACRGGEIRLVLQRCGSPSGYLENNDVCTAISCGILKYWQLTRYSEILDYHNVDSSAGDVEGGALAGAQWQWRILWY